MSVAYGNMPKKARVSKSCALWAILQPQHSWNVLKNRAADSDAILAYDG